MEYLLISDAAKRVQVESHVLRYWEEELKLPIKRNEAGHRYYTDSDIERFLQIKSMKERGLQLKAIKMILKDGKLDVLPMGEARAELGEIETVQESVETERAVGLAIDIVPNKRSLAESEESKEEKAQRLQWLLKQLIKETLEENNRQLCKEIRDGVVKELDYQFRCQEERETEREKQREQRSEEYYRKMDELLRKKSGRLHREKMVKEKAVKDKMQQDKSTKAAEVKEQLMLEKQAKETVANASEKVLPLKKKRHLFS
ncbi:MAG: MerR family transcriptional regulator [Lachnospiraceae bacterium]|nr:MerR family transcriptional regulator [Lachnospiraceae bacterium]